MLAPIPFGWDNSDICVHCLPKIPQWKLDFIAYCGNLFYSIHLMDSFSLTFSLPVFVQDSPEAEAEPKIQT